MRLFGFGNSKKKSWESMFFFYNEDDNSITIINQYWIWIKYFL